MKGIKIQSLKDSELFIINERTGIVYQLLKKDFGLKVCIYENLFTKRTFSCDFKKFDQVYTLKAWMGHLRKHEIFKKVFC